MSNTPSPTPQDDELERGVDISILLRTKIRNTLYNNEIGFSMKNAGSRNAVQMVDDLVEQLAAHAEHLIQKAHEDGYREGELSGAKGLHNYVFNHFELLPKINNPKVGRGTTHSTVFTEGNYQHVACQYIEMIEAELNAKREKK